MNKSREKNCTQNSASLFFMRTTKCSVERVGKIFHSWCVQYFSFSSRSIKYYYISSGEAFFLRITISYWNNMRDKIFTLLLIKVYTRNIYAFWKNMLYMTVILKKSSNGIMRIQFYYVRKFYHFSLLILKSRSSCLKSWRENKDIISPAIKNTIFWEDLFIVCV